MIVRVRDANGMKRVQMEAWDTVGQLKIKIADACGMLVSSVVLSDVRGGDGATLSDVGISHGDIVRVENFVQSAEAQKPLVAAGSGSGGGPSADGGDGTKRLRDIKMAWTLNDWLVHEAQHTVEIKAPKDPHTTMCGVDFAGANAFQVYLRNVGFTMHRFGIMYGRIDEDEVEVEAIYEPPQAGNDETVLVLEDPRRQTADALAALFDLQPVGIIFSRRPLPPPEDEEKPKSVMRGAELLLLAQAQLDMGKHAVGVVVEPTDEGLVNFECFQATEQCVDLLERGALAPHAEAEDAVAVVKNDSVHSVVVERADTDRVDCSMLLHTVGIEDMEGMFMAKFPVENRPDHVQALGDLKAHMERFAHKPFVQRAKDFHLLLFMTQFLSVEADFPPLVDAMKSGSGDTSVTEQLFTAYAQQM